jgi:tRNA(Ile)-lysidine synthase
MKHVLRAAELAINGDVGAVAEFTSGVHMRVDYDALVFETTDQSPALNDQYLLPDSVTMLPLLIPGETSVPEMEWSVIIRQGEDNDVYNSTTLQIARELPEGLWLRRRQAGDRFHPAGMEGHSQKVSDWMINLKIPRELRDRVPLVADSSQIYAILWNKRWYPGHQLVLDNEKSILLQIIQ